MTDSAHEHIAALIHGVAGCLQPNNLPAVDLADLRVIFQDDGGRCTAGVGTASGVNRVEAAVASALRDLATQIRNAQDHLPNL